MIDTPEDTGGPTLMGFSKALTILKLLGNELAVTKVAREGWNGKDMWIALQVPDSNSKMTLPYIYMKTAQGDLVPWLASQSDILAEDWFVITA